MPIFPGPVSHNNPNQPIVDATVNQVKGLGFFADVAARDSLSANLQSSGYFAVVDSTAYIFSGATWSSAASWTELGASGLSLPSGNAFEVLFRNSSGVAQFTSSPRTSEFSVFNSVGTSSPSMAFTRTSGAGGVALATASGDVLGSLAFSGHDSADAETQAGAVVFTQVGAAAAGVIKSKLEVSVGTSSGKAVAFSINEERVVSIPQLSSVPTAVLGGLYSDTSSNLYFGT
jgi:hypothetical protein